MLEDWEIFFDPEDGEYRETITNERPLDVPMDAAAPCKKGTNNARLKKLKREVVNPTRFQKQSKHVSWRRMSPRDNVWYHLYRKIMKITSQAKGYIRWPITIWCTSLFPCLKRWKFRMRRQQWTRIGRSLRRFQPNSWRKSEAGRKLFWKHKETKRKSTLLHWWTSVISEMRSENQQFQK